MPTLVKMRSLFLPVSIGLFVVLAAGLYNFAWLLSQDKYLDSRNFRLLSTLGEELSTSVNTFDKMLDNAADSGVIGIDKNPQGNDENGLKEYLQQVAPRLESVDSQDREVLGDDYGDPPNIAPPSAAWNHFSYFPSNLSLA